MPIETQKMKMFKQRKCIKTHILPKDTHVSSKKNIFMVVRIKFIRILVGVHSLCPMRVPLNEGTPKQFCP